MANRTSKLMSTMAVFSMTRFVFVRGGPEPPG